MALRLTVLPTSTRSGHGPGRFGKDELGSRQISVMGEWLPLTGAADWVTDTGDKVTNTPGGADEAQTNCPVRCWALALLFG